MTKVNVTDIVTDGATLSPISDMDIDMAADVAADVAFFFQTGPLQWAIFQPTIFSSPNSDHLYGSQKI